MPPYSGEGVSGGRLWGLEKLEQMGGTDRVRRAQGAIHCDFPLEEIGFVDESDGDAGWRVSSEIT